MLEDLISVCIYRLDLFEIIKCDIKHKRGYMKKLVSSVLCFIFMAGSTLMATSGPQEVQKRIKPRMNFSVDSEDIEFLSIGDLTKKNLAEFFQGQLPYTAIKFDKGFDLPLKFSMAGQFLTENQEQSLLNDLEPFYLRYANDEFLFSSDGELWTNFGDFFDINMDVNVGLTKNMTILKLSMKLHPANQMSQKQN